MAATPGDRRELILARLAVVLAACVPERNFQRNPGSLDEYARPGIALMDADENPVLQRPPNSPARAPVLMGLTPEIYIFADGAGDVNPGTKLNALRQAIIRAVLTDSALLALCTDDAIQYEGFASGFAAGRTLEGEGGIGFTFMYALYPDKIPAP